MNRLPRLDWVLLAAVLALLVMSTLLVWSATAHRVDLTGGDSTVFLPIDDIDWVEAADYYVEIHAGERSFLMRETMQRLQAQLDERFVRIHRSRLVNRDRIRSLRTESRGEMVVVTTSGVSLKVARSCRAKLETRPATATAVVKKIR